MFYHGVVLGEPLMNKDIYELSTLAAKYVPIVKTTSNGTTLTKKNVVKIKNSGIKLFGSKH